MQIISTQDIFLFLPEIILVATIIILIVFDLIIEKPSNKRRYLMFIALLGLIVSSLTTLCFENTKATSAFFDQIAIDPFALLFKKIFAVITIISILTSRLSKELSDKYIGEYFILLLGITFGMNLMASANDLLMVYLSIEMVSIVSYALAGYRLHSRRSSEAALKYAIYGGAASAVMLFGISLFYGMFGTTELSTLNYALGDFRTTYFTQDMNLISSVFPLTLLMSIVFIFAGIGYKIAVVPFHMWSPDVYEGAPTPFTGFLSVGPKAAGFALLIRIFVGIFVEPNLDETSTGLLTDTNGLMQMTLDLPLPAILGVISALTMTFGNLAAIPQNNVKRLLAYSSIAHAGYLLMGFVVFSEQSLKSVIFYLIIYYLMNIGAFIIVQVVRDHTGGESIDNFNDLGQREPILAMCMTVFLLSLTGLPPFAGFIGKFYIFASVMERSSPWYTSLAIVGVINSTISLYYYMRIVKSMWFKKTKKTLPPLQKPRIYSFISSAIAILLIVLGLYWTHLATAIDKSIQFYRSAPTIKVIKTATLNTYSNKKK